jgi:hypothetical protein
MSRRAVRLDVRVIDSVMAAMRISARAIHRLMTMRRDHSESIDPPA